jgi:hypothetical protein
MFYDTGPREDGGGGGEIFGERRERGEKGREIVCVSERERECEGQRERERVCK